MLILKESMCGRKMDNLLAQLQPGGACMWLFQANVQKGYCVYSARFLFNLYIYGNDPITFFLIGMAVRSRSCLRILAFEVRNGPVRGYFKQG